MPDNTPAYTAEKPPKPTGVGKENGDFGGGNGYGFWGWSDTKKDWVWTDTYANQQSAYAASGPHLTASGGGTNTGAPKPSYDPNLAGPSQVATGPNPFGNEMMGYQQQYTPFGLQSAFGSSGGGGGGGAPYSYLSDQLVPSLEARRMGMMTQMFNPGGR